MIQQLTNNLEFVHPFLFFKHRLLWSPCDGAKFKHCIFQLLFDRNNFSLKGWFCYCCSKISFFIFGHLKPETFLLLDLCLLECSLRFSFNFWNQRSKIWAVNHRWIRGAFFTSVNGGGGRCLFFQNFVWFSAVRSCDEENFENYFQLIICLKKRQISFSFFYIIHLIQCLHLRCDHILWTQLTDFVASLNFKTLVLGSLRMWKGCKKS